MRRVMGYSAAALLLLSGTLFLVLWSSELEAQYVNIGFVVGRDSGEPRVTTRAIGLVLVGLGVVAAAATLLASQRRREAPGSQNRR